MRCLKRRSRCDQICDPERSFWLQIEEGTKIEAGGLLETVGVIQMRNEESESEVFGNWMTVLGSHGTWIIWILGGH